MRVVGLALAVALLAGIGVNAMYFQTARHPAPLFASGGDKTAARNIAASPAAPAPTPVPASRPAELTGAGAPMALQRANVQAALRPPAPLARESVETTTAKKDLIAALIKSDAPVEAEKPASPKVAAAQRALQKVGFVVKPDGVFGLGTRQALEKFERDRGLPVTGALAGRTVKELAAQSGVAIP